MAGVMNKKTLSNLMSIEKRKFEAAVERYKNMHSFARVNHNENSLKRPRPAAESEQTLASMNGPSCAKRDRRDADGLNETLNQRDLAYAILPDGAGFEAELDGICNVEIKEEYVPEDEPQFQAINESAVSLPEHEKPTLKGIFDLLKNISQRMTTMETRMAAIEHTVRENCVKYPLIAQNQLMRENLTVTKQILKSTKRLLGDDEDDVEINFASRLPLATMDDILDLEEYLKEPNGKQTMKMYLTKIRGTSTLQDLFRHIIEDKLVEEFNWDGRTGKRALRSLTLFNNILPNVYSNIASKDLEKNFRKCVEMSHNRYKQRKYSDRKKLNATDPQLEMKPQEEDKMGSSFVYM